MIRRAFLYGGGTTTHALGYMIDGSSPPLYCPSRWTMVQHEDTLEVNKRNDVIGLNGLDVLGPLGPREGPGPA